MNPLGASLHGDGTTFRVWAPRCRTVDLAIEGRAPERLRDAGDGIRELTVPTLLAGARYQYRLDGERYRPDPVSRWQPEGVHGPSVVVDPTRFAWTDHGFRGGDLRGPGSRNWGYDGVHLYAPQSTYGGPQGLRRLVDACHAQGLSEGNYLAEYGPYFTDRYQTPWGSAVNFDGPTARACAGTSWRTRARGSASSTWTASGSTPCTRSSTRARSTSSPS